MHDIMKQIGKRLRALRKSHKYTQEQVAEKAGINSTYYGRVERGEANISLELLIPLARSLEVSLSELLDIESEKSKEQIVKELIQLLQNASENEVKLVYRFARDLFTS